MLPCEVDFLYPRTAEATKTHWCVRRQEGTRTESLSQHTAFKGIISYCLSLISGVYLWNHASNETTVIIDRRMPCSAPTPKSNNRLIPTGYGFSFYIGKQMSKALVCDGEIVFSKQTDVTIRAHRLQPIQTVNAWNACFHVFFWRLLNTLQETWEEWRTFLQVRSYFKWRSIIGRYSYLYPFSLAYYITYYNSFYVPTIVGTLRFLIFCRINKWLVHVSWPWSETAFFCYYQFHDDYLLLLDARL